MDATKEKKQRCPSLDAQLRVVELRKKYFQVDIYTYILKYILTFQLLILEIKKILKGSRYHVITTVEMSSDPLSPPILLQFYVIYEPSLHITLQLGLCPIIILIVTLLRIVIQRMFWNFNGFIYFTFVLFHFQFNYTLSSKEMLK